MTQQLPLEIDTETLAALNDGGEALTTIDIREAAEVQANPFDANLHIPMSQLPGHLDRLPRDENLIIVCAHGHRSLQVMEWLRGNGFENTASLRGGVAAWNQRAGI